MLPQIKVHVPTFALNNIFHVDPNEHRNYASPTKRNTKQRPKVKKSLLTACNQVAVDGMDVRTRVEAFLYRGQKKKF